MTVAVMAGVMSVLACWCNYVGSNAVTNWVTGVGGVVLHMRGLTLLKSGSWWLISEAVVCRSGPITVQSVIRFNPAAHVAEKILNASYYSVQFGVSFIRFEVIFFG